ncbi:MAG: hypothetical protein LBU41_00305 [Clostridiales Family XIII bacterium]|nr:hypothetical protein [Clostridiales Family XIII bacterium]
MEIIKFIQNNLDWENVITEAPYFIKVKRLENYVLLKYDQIRSDFNLQIVRECRGIIFDESDRYRPVCVPFFKFGNYGESYVPDIDWATAVVQEKMDGSIIKLWHNRDIWHVSSNSEIDARKAKISSVFIEGQGKTDLCTLFWKAWQDTGVVLSALDPAFTYLFELTSPYNRVVVRYPMLSIWHIGARNNTTFEERELNIGIPKPRRFDMHNLDEVIEAAQSLDDNEEGFVIVDGFYQRVKVKSPKYVLLNHMVQGISTEKHIITLIIENEQKEFLSYFPEYESIISCTEERINSFCVALNREVKAILAMRFSDRKSMAAVVTKTRCPACIFAILDGKNASPREWLFGRPPGRISELISAQV